MLLTPAPGTDTKRFLLSEAKEGAMTQACVEDARFDVLVESLNEAYLNSQLDDYRLLELKDSRDEQTTCRVQWGPMMRA